MNKDLLAIIHKIYNETGRCPGKKQLQKMVYLIQAKGIDLGYEYDIHFYGPYSDDLSHDLLSLCVNGFVDFRMKGQTHEIVPLEESVEMSISSEEETLVDSLIREYKNESPSGLELITTTHFVAVNIGSSDNDIVSGVKRIKGEKYPNERIKAVIDDLRAGYIM